MERKILAKLLMERDWEIDLSDVRILVEKLLSVIVCVIDFGMERKLLMKLLSCND
jgi:hypothetical protein